LNQKLANPENLTYISSQPFILIEGLDMIDVDAMDRLISSTRKMTSESNSFV
jgi:hypothetical protein